MGLKHALPLSVSIAFVIECCKSRARVFRDQSGKIRVKARNKDLMPELTIIGGGLSGCEAAWQAAKRGIQVTLYEMRPKKSTGAHVTGDLAELVCSNSLGSLLPDRASGVLKNELSALGSLLLACAEESAVPAGFALAVDRERFSGLIGQKLTAHPNIRVLRQEITELPVGPTVIASGPLTSPDLAHAIQQFTGEDSLYFYDAVAPVIAAESIDLSIAFRASRYHQREDEGGGDYLNCPLSNEEYDAFVTELLAAERIPLKPFEQEILSGVHAGSGKFFESCLPVEIIVERSRNALKFGPMRPVGLHDPRTGQRSGAILQLRQDNLAGSLYNMVGFQTNLTYAEQKRVFRMIPGLQNAEFVRYGQMHRNTFLCSPLLLQPTMQSNQREDLFMAGQITGVEGYLGNIATGLLAGINAALFLKNEPLIVLPETTMLGALCHYITHTSLMDFQPMKANFGILPPLRNPKRGRRERSVQYADRASEDLHAFLRHFSTLVPDGREVE